MEAVRYIWSLNDYLLIIIPLASSVMITYQSFRRFFSDNDAVIEDCKIKIRHTIIGTIIAMTISATITFVKNYFI